MKKIAVITGGLLPLPATKGGAIETLLQYVIDDNENDHKFDFDVYSIFDSNSEKESQKYNYTNFKYIFINSFVNKFVNLYFKILRKLGINKDPNFQFLYLKKVCKSLKNKKYDFILIESDNHFVLDIKKIINSPIILYLHNDKLNYSTKDSKQIVDACYRILTVSNYITKRVQTIDFKEKNKVVTILNGIDTSKFLCDNQKKIREDMRKKYNIYDNDFVFLYTGRIEKEKGVYELIEAFNSINKENKKLIIAGGSFYSSNKKTKYVKTIENLISSNKNIIVTGYINSNDIFKYHFMSDAIVTPSQWDEPGSLVNQEAFASGLPLISSNSGGTPEYTKDTKAILINRGENFINDLCDAMTSLIDNPFLCDNMKKSQLKVSEYFCKERYCEDLKQFLEGE